MIRLRSRALTAGFVVALAPAAVAYPLEIAVAETAVEAEGRLEFLAVGRLDSDSPRQDPQGRIGLRLGADLSSWGRVVTAVTGTAGGTPRDAGGPGAYDFAHTLQDLSPSLELDEAYLDLFLDSVDLRAGVQKFTWGRLDGVQPNDLINPEKLYDPLLDDEIERQIGVPALTVVLRPPLGEPSLLPEDVRVTLVGVPYYVPFRVADDDERWYPPLARVPRETRTMGLVVENRGRFRNADAPDDPFADGAVAARVSGFGGGVDFGLYYYEGYDTQPAFEAEAEGFARLDLRAPGGFRVRSEIDVFPTYDRIRSLGADVATSLFGATVRAEAAYLVGRLYPRAVRDVVDDPRIGAFDPLQLALGQETAIPIELSPVNVERDGLEWGVNADGFVGETFVLVQMMQTTVLGNSADLIISDFETRFAMTIRRSFLADRLVAELLGAYGMQGVYGFAHPRVTYDLFDGCDVRVGYLMLAGHEESIVGQYRENDQLTLRLRYLF